MFTKIKDNRLLSFLVIFIVYIIATICAVIVFNTLNFTFWLNLLISDIVATIVVFIFSLIFNNASVYDPYWSVQPIVIIILLAFKYSLSLVTILPLCAISYWAIRLTTNWAYTFKNLNHQDWRYVMLKEKTKKLYFFINFIGIHLVPTLVVYSCVVGVAYLFISTNTTVNIVSIFGLLISIGATTTQGIADYQMHKFRKEHTGELIRTGLWKYSRHPNYLGEILMWYGMGIYVVGALQGQVYFLLGAVCNTCLFLFISIPLAETHQKERKSGYDEYKLQTRMLLPIKKSY